MDLDFLGGGPRVENGMERKGRTGRWRGTNVSKKSVMLVVYIYYASFLPSPLCKKRKERLKIFLFPHFPKKSNTLPHPRPSSSFFFFIRPKEKKKKKVHLHLHLPQFPCLTFHFSTLSFNHPLIHLSCPSLNFECSIISPNRILKSK